MAIEQTVATLAPGERIDRLARRIYGDETTGGVEALLAANPGLADYGGELPGGLALSVPNITAESIRETIRPWE
ncbi:phage tail protein X [Hoeflea marina]|uniref:Phage tail protein X n=2 Tax=Hoeflea marina TaxID=274592 RepID=A0A317PI36_9HYPH|nr:phage tail protein X [Hoeflea marina]